MPKRTIPENVGIIASTCYFPQNFVEQSDLEQYDKVSEGKYTIGLGQKRLSFITPKEDVTSMALTVLSQLVSDYKIDLRNVGRLEVATETLQDHSKSIKTFLMRLFEESGNFNVEGVDSMNACYAATNALLNSVGWVESNDWEGKIAIVVAVDVAEYEKGPARPAGGCGAVAFAIGPDAPLVLEPKCRFSHMRHVFDFYKPFMDSPFPVVDGHFSNECYLKALDECYKGFTDRFERNKGEEISLLGGEMDFLVFHSPFNKLVRKSLARMVFNDYQKEKFKSDDIFREKIEFLTQFTIDNSLRSRELMTCLVKLSSDLYNDRVAPSTLFPMECGNSYTASAYMGLMSLLANKKANDLVGKRIVIFSYGSGCASTMFSLKVKESVNLSAMCSIAERSKERLRGRNKCSPQFFEETMRKREELYLAREFTNDLDDQKKEKGVFYLEGKDSKGRRSYRLIE